MGLSHKGILGLIIKYKGCKILGSFTCKECPHHTRGCNSCEESLPRSIEMTAMICDQHTYRNSILGDVKCTVCGAITTGQGTYFDEVGIPFPENNDHIDQKKIAFRCPNCKVIDTAYKSLCGKEWICICDHRFNIDDHLITEEESKSDLHGLAQSENGIKEDHITEASKKVNNIEISDQELWCLLVGLEYCDGEDFNPLTEKLIAIRDLRSKRSCDNCKTHDGQDCRVCNRNDDPDRGKPLHDQWRDTP